MNTRLTFTLCAIVLSTAFGWFLGPSNPEMKTAWVATGFLVAGVLSLLLSVLYAISDCQYSAAVDEERASRPIGRLEVQQPYHNEEGWQGNSGGAHYGQASAPPLPVAKMEPMNIQ
jgi:hypothetical protein